ncbi:MAG: hypothetical protein U9N57_08865 [Pseudomonadota bacterium]|nr:hypothetical protein [Pseudomonadota bacterium]
MHSKKFEILHILAALGAAGMTASFFFAVNYMTVHPGKAFVDFDTLMANHIGQLDLLSLFIQLYILGAVAAASLHFVLLKRWFKGFNVYRKTQDYQDLLNSNREVQLMAIPLTLTMTMNVFFILGALFIPGLFDSFSVFGFTMQVIDPMFIMAGVYFSVIFILALKIFSKYFLRLIDGELDFIQNANLSQLLALFSFGMIGVGFGALGFSKIPEIAFIGTALSYTVIGLTVMLSILKFVLGFKSMFEHGINAQATVTLLIPVTVIAMLIVGTYRADIGTMHTLGLDRNTTYHLILFTIGIGVSFLIGLFALTAMRNKGFFKAVNDNKTDAGALALVCPGFAFEVQLVLWLSIGMVNTGLITHGSTGYFVMWLPMITLQMITIYLFFKLLKQNKFLRFDFKQLHGLPKQADMQTA